MKRIKKIACLVIFVAVLGFCIKTAADIVQTKSSDFKYVPFFEQEEDFDVLFMGTSHVINGIFPMELWNDYGIVSYNFGGHANQIATTYWVMENALDYTTPKLMVIDVLAVESSAKVSANSSYIHLSFDCFPISKTKIQGIYDLCDDPEKVDQNGINYYDCRWEYIWDFGKYHTRWTGLSKNEITNESVSKEKGAESRIAVATPNEYKLVDSDVVLDDPDTVGMAYLKKMIEDCQARGIEVLLVYLPYPAGSDAQIAANSVYAVAEEYGIDYLNFVAMDSVVDYDTDCYDGGSHLNPSGARKVTEYLGEYISEHYDVPDRRTDAAYEGWYEDYETYVDYKLQNIENQTSLENALMLLAEDDSFSCCVYVKEDSQILGNEKITALLNNIMGKNYSAAMVKAGNVGSGYLMVNDSIDGEITELTSDRVVLDTSFGELTYSGNGYHPYLYIADEVTNLLNGDWNKIDSTTTEPDMRIWVIDNRTGEIAYTSMWDYAVTEGITLRK